MHVKDWMASSVVSTKPRESVEHARKLLEKHRIRQLPVLVEGKVRGIVTDRDLRDAYPSVFDHGDRGPSVKPTNITVEDVMTENVITLTPETPLEDAARIMNTERIGAIPVVVEERCVGILARSDVLRAFVALTETAEWSAFTQEASS